MTKLILFKDHRSHCIHWGYASVDTLKQLHEFSKYFRKFNITFITLTFSNEDERHRFINNFFEVKK